MITAMSQADHDRWYAARSLADLGSATADWLERRMESLTGYEPGAGPDDETTDLVPVLAALNRHGFVTTSSQPGRPDTGDGWRQRAAVTGFASARMMDRVRDLYAPAWCPDVTASDTPGVPLRPGVTGLWDFALSPADPRKYPGVVVSADGDDVVTTFGGRLNRDDIDEVYPDCCPSMRAVVGEVMQLTLFDPAWGRNTLLWESLERLAG